MKDDVYLAKWFNTSADTNMFRCRECWMDATDGFANGWVPTRPYPHSDRCTAVRDREAS